MGARMFLVDIEATSPTPHSGVMTEFGVVDYTSRDWFHGHLWDFHPHPDIPALPIADTLNPSVHTRDTSRRSHDTEQAVFVNLVKWLHDVCDGTDSAVFVSDNPAFDFMWMAVGFDRSGLKNPFGFSARRIGDLAAGLSGNWRNTNSWKKHRKTVHDHNPINDALGNAEALEYLLRKHGQIKEIG